VFYPGDVDGEELDDRELERFTTTVPAGVGGNNTEVLSGADTRLFTAASSAPSPASPSTAPPPIFIPLRFTRDTWLVSWRMGKKDETPCLVARTGGDGLAEAYECTNQGCKPILDDGGVCIHCHAVSMNGLSERLLSGRLEPHPIPLPPDVPEAMCTGQFRQVWWLIAPTVSSTILHRIVSVLHIFRFLLLVFCRFVLST
jgi:hypothetical protein